MPKVATAPLPLSQAAATRSRSREREAPVYPRSTESRVSALEARWEETVPKLATNADLRGTENRLIVWILGAAGTLLLSLLGIFFAGYNSLNSRIDSLGSELRTEIREVNARMDAAISDLRSELKAELRETNARFEKIDARFEKLDGKFDALMDELRRQRSDSR